MESVLLNVKVSHSDLVIEPVENERFNGYE